jgi:hypothetical protein
MNDRKKNLLKLFTDDVEYYFHIIKNDIGHIIYLSEGKDEYSTDGLEFKLNKIMEGFLENLEITFERIAPALYFTTETNTEKLKYELGEDFKKNDKFDNFVEEIKDTYRDLEVAEFLLYKKDPEAYEKMKNDEYKKEQSDIWEKYKKQQVDTEISKRETISDYNGDLIKLFVDNLQSSAIKEKGNFKFKQHFTNLIFSMISDDEEQSKLWPLRDGHPISGNDKFEPIRIDGSELDILLADRMSNAYVIKLNLNGPNLDIIDIQEHEGDILFMKDYEFLMKIFDFNISSNFIDWNQMYETEKLEATIVEIERLKNEKQDLKEKEKLETIDSSTAKAFFKIDDLEIEISTESDVISANISDELFQPVKDILNKYKIDFKVTENILKNSLEFIELINKKQIENIYFDLIKIGYMLDTHRQEVELDFMDLRKPSIPNIPNITNSSNNTINMNDFEIVIGDTPYNDWGLDVEEATPINGIVFHDGAVYDDHIDEHFPQIQSIGLFGEMEGQLSYEGELTKQEIVTSLNQMGFNARVGNLEI